MGTGIQENQGHLVPDHRVGTCVSVERMLDARSEAEHRNLEVNVAEQESFGVYVGACLKKTMSGVEFWCLRGTLPLINRSIPHVLSLSCRVAIQRPERVVRNVARPQHHMEILAMETFRPSKQLFGTRKARGEARYAES